MIRQEPHPGGVALGILGGGVPPVLQTRPDDNLVPRFSLLPLSTGRRENLGTRFIRPNLARVVEKMDSAIHWINH